MEVAAKLDEYGKPAWIGVMILGFIVFWPIGLAILFYMIWSGRMGCSKYYTKHGGQGRWWNTEHKRHRHRRKNGGGRSSGNLAFDEYKEETLRRLEDEQKDFHDYLEQLRMAKDKTEFDQFMTDRKNRPDKAEDITDVTEIDDEPEAPETKS